MDGESDLLGDERGEDQVGIAFQADAATDQVFYGGDLGVYEFANRRAGPVPPVSKS